MPRTIRQLALNLSPPPSWGGRRDGAGRKRGSHPRDPHRSRQPLHPAHPCHVTLKLRRGIPSLRTVRFVREFERSLRVVRDRSWFRVVYYTLQSGHIHLIVEASSSRDLAAGMKSIGARVARAVARVFGLRGSVLSDRFHLHVLRSPREVRNAIAYVLLNARRHLAKSGRRVAVVRSGVRSTRSASLESADLAVARRLASPRSDRRYRGAGTALIADGEVDRAVLVDANSVADSTQPHNAGSSVLEMKRGNPIFHIVKTSSGSSLRSCAEIWDQA